MHSTLFILLNILNSLYFYRHDFHASVTEIEYNPQTQELEATARLFTDDLHAALAFNYDSLYEAADSIPLAIDSLVARYMGEALQLSRGVEALPVKYIGREEMMDITYVYLTFAVSEKPATLEVYNALFFGMFDDQTNIVNLQWEQWQGSLFIKKSQPRETISIP